MQRKGIKGLIYKIYINFANAVRRLINRPIELEVNRIRSEVRVLGAPRLKSDFKSLLERLIPSEKERLSIFSDQILGELARHHAFEPLHPWKLQQQLDAILRGKPSLHSPEKSRTTAGKPLKILYLTGMFPSIDHAGGLRLFDIISHLSKRHTLDLYSCFHPALDAKSHHALKPYLSADRVVEFHGFGPADLDAWFHKRGIEPGHYDVIQLEYPQSSVFVDVARKYGARIGFTLMECVSRSRSLDLIRALDEEEPKTLGQTISDLVHYAWVESYALRACDFSVAVTDVDAEFAERMSGVKPHVVISGISEFVFGKSEPAIAKSSNKTVAFVGYYDHTPNIEGMKWYLGQIHPVVKKLVPDYRILIIGRGNTHLLQKISSGDPSVVYTGRVDDLAGEIKKAAICISPLISGAGFRGKINQYSYCGKPTISTSIGVSGMPYVHGKSVLVADDSSSFASSIVELLTNDRRHEEITRGAIAVIDQHYSWESIIPRLEAIYSE